jgi:hypothetical protein
MIRGDGVKTIILASLAFLLFCGTATVQGFDPPESDPWYYQSDDHGIEFWVPDKAQHYWGSLLLNEVGKRLPLPAGKITSPVLSFSAGFFYEVWQDTQGIGFSKRDLAADALGVISSQFSGDSVKMWMDYSTVEKIIIFKFRYRFR